MNLNNPEELEKDLNFLIVNGLVEKVIGTDGETRYKATDNTKQLTPEQLIEIVAKGLENQ
jgi:hypothetical protein